MLDLLLVILTVERFILPNFQQHSEDSEAGDQKILVFGWRFFLAFFSDICENWVDNSVDQGINYFNLVLLEGIRKIVFPRNKKMMPSHLMRLEIDHTDS